MQLSQKFVYKVRAALSEKGTSLHKICLDNDINTGNIYPILRGEINTEKAVIDRSIVIKAAFSDRQIKKMKLFLFMTDLNQTSPSSLAGDASALPVADLQQ